jgi:hypothetical protein
MMRRVTTLRFAGLLRICCLAWVFFVMPALLRADTIYTYVGNPYTECEGTYVCNGKTPALSLRLDTPLMGSQLDNLSNDWIPVSTFYFTDGMGYFITQANQVFHDLIVSTDAHGNITNWYIVALTTERPPYAYFRLNSWRPNRRGGGRFNPWAQSANHRLW